MFLKTHRQFRHRETGETSERIMDLVGEEVTIDGTFTASTDQLEEYRTLFKEIEVLPYQLVISGPENIKYIGDRLNYRTFIERLRGAIVQAVKNSWDDEKVHIINHSSGYDSRILSHIIRKLYRKKMINGEILFVCYQPEGDMFKKIMEYEEWPEKNYMVYNEDVAPCDYYARCLDFDNNWRSFNGLSQWPSDILYWVIKDLQAQDILPDDDMKIQSYGMGFADELLEHKFIHKNKSSIYKFLETYYFNKFPQSMSNFDGDRVLPMLDTDILRLIIEPDWGNHKVADVKERLLKMMDPRLYQFRNTSPYTTKNPYYHMAESLMNRVRSDYENSWYGKYVRPDMVMQATRVLSPAPWWASWQAASVVEHLREMGVKINMKRWRAV